MHFCTGHTYESNIVRSAKRVAYFGQVELSATSLSCRPS